MSNYPLPIPGDEDMRRLSLLTRVMPWCTLVLGFVAGVMFCATVLVPDARDASVCHAPTEDSRIVDCDYRDGAWHPGR